MLLSFISANQTLKRHGIRQSSPKLTNSASTVSQSSSADRSSLQSTTIRSSTSSTSQNAVFCPSSTTSPLSTTGPRSFLASSSLRLSTLGAVRLMPFTMYLVWSLFANHHDSRNSHEEFSDVDKKIDICMRYKKTADKEAV